MIIEDQLDRGAGRISGVETLEEFDELSAAVAVSDERMDLPGKQVDSGQQAKRAMTFVLVIPREGRVDAGLGRHIGCRRCDGLDSRFFVVGDDRHRLAWFVGFGSPFQDLDPAINAQNLRHLLLELAGSVRDRERPANLSISSSVIANSTPRRHPAMIPLLVLLIANKESATKPS